MSFYDIRWNSQPTHPSAHASEARVGMPPFTTCGGTNSLTGPRPLKLAYFTTKLEKTRVYIYVILYYTYLYILYYTMYMAYKINKCTHMASTRTKQCRLCQLLACKELMEASESTSISSRPMRVQMLLGKWMDALKNCWYQAILKSESDLIVTCCVVRNGTYFHWGSNGWGYRTHQQKYTRTPINLSGRWLKELQQNDKQANPASVAWTYGICGRKSSNANLWGDTSWRLHRE